ncbi:hypothetical protein EI42_03696 [Thermosporothrix hazakensis]|jgi:hypothetical protein|uniref:Uncharacterized protein n=1 Tax=Thermosporothrix hazakensis TaxID=644383 RepID=A0A326U5T8_THEHA|nr:hypothetical protein EI42_03696 [Thermosporothrix hazakensis]GCE50418.1 hypothetical protein KTH_52870 [Thermosporothrix hazakensis]
MREGVEGQVKAARDMLYDPEVDREEQEMLMLQGQRKWPYCIGIERSSKMCS